MSDNIVINIPDWDTFIDGDKDTAERIMLTVAMGILDEHMDEDIVTIWNKMRTIATLAIEELNEHG